MNYIHYPLDAFPIHDRLHQCVSAFSFGDDGGRRGDRLFSPRNDAQQATRLPHSSVKRDHDALNEGCTRAMSTCVKNKLVRWTFSANTCVRPPPLDTACVIMAQINYGHTVTMPRDLLQHRVSNDPQKIAHSRRVRRHTQRLYCRTSTSAKGTNGRPGIEKQASVYLRGCLYCFPPLVIFSRERALIGGASHLS